jgi:Putative beta-barrel porin-2, OmpL-like. bbp2
MTGRISRFEVEASAGAEPRTCPRDCVQKRLGICYGSVPIENGNSGLDRMCQFYSIRQHKHSRSGTAVMQIAVMILYAFIGREAHARQFSQTNSSDAATADRQDPSKPPWQYGGFLDFGYLLDFNHPSNHLFRSRSTTFKVDELDLNMAGVYVKKEASQQSRWGMELTLQAGKDSEGFGFSPTAPKVDGAKWLRHLGPTDLSYLAPVGKGLTIQAGLFSSLIGYDSLYAKDNFNYTRPWEADFTPYLMFGVNAAYPFTDRLTGTFYVINGYAHLAHANNVPSWGGQVAFRATDHLTLKETLLYGPQQADTSLGFWRFFSDSIAEQKWARVTLAFEYQVGTEKVAISGRPRAWWNAAQLPVRWTLRGPWSVTVRPEFCRDPEGRWTGFDQTVKAVTTTLEYRFPYRWTNTIVRLEYRYDDSRGSGGGFFKDGQVQPGVVGLTPSQQLLILGVVVTLDSPGHPQI